MSAIAWIKCAVYVAVLLVLVKPLGAYLAHVAEGKELFLTRVLGPVERGIYRLAGIAPDREMGWKEYARGMLAFQLVGFLALFALLRFQGHLPLNPQGVGPLSWHLAFDTAVSFVTNTNWQSYGGETTLSYLSQALGLTVQNFVSAATGLAILFALVRGFARRNADEIGSFWVDLVRSTLYVFLPLSVLLALGLASQGVVQTVEPYVRAHTLESPETVQTIALGPAASQIAIKELGTNGGGFFNVNSAHPFENPTPLSSFLELLAILALPAACCYAFGRGVRDTRQGWALLASMLALFVPLLVGAIAAEGAGNPRLDGLGLAADAGNLEGKEVRFGVVDSATWAVATTAASNGSVEAMHDSFTPLGGLVPMVLMQLGEVVFGGVGSGLYGMVVFALVAVFVAGLMIGRTPEYMGKKIEAFEMKMASLAVLAPCLAVLVGTAVAAGSAAGRASLANPGAHGFSEMLYAFSSAANNNGSAFAGLNANTPFYDVGLGIAMLVGRYFVAVPVLAIAGSLAAKKTVTASSGTLATHTPLFVLLLVALLLIVGALTFVPALALGPLVEHLQMVRA